MKISTQVNDGDRVVSEVTGKSFLGAHVILNNPEDEDEAFMDIRVSGHDINDPKETVYSEWESRKLRVGDLIKIEIEPQGEALVPKSITSSKDRDMLDVSSEQADRVLSVFQESDRLLDDFLKEIQGELEPEVFKQIALAVGKRMTINLQSIKTPIYRKYPDKRPEELKGFRL